MVQVNVDNKINSMNKRRKKYWCVEYYDPEFGYNSWGDFLLFEDAKNTLKILEEKYPERKWENNSNSGFLIKERLLHEEQIKVFKL